MFGNVFDWLGWVLTRYIDLYILLCGGIAVLFVPLVLGIFMMVWWCLGCCC